MRTISSLVIAVLVISFLFFTFTENGNAGLGDVPVEMGCAQIIDDGVFRCCEFDLGILCLLAPGDVVIGEFEGATCNKLTGLCSGFDPGNFSRNIPTISEWGLIATAGVLGIIGFMVIRRRNASA